MAGKAFLDTVFKMESLLGVNSAHSVQGICRWCGAYSNITVKISLSDELKSGALLLMTSDACKSFYTGIFPVCDGCYRTLAAFGSISVIKSIHKPIVESRGLSVFSLQKENDIVRAFLKFKKLFKGDVVRDVFVIPNDDFSDSEFKQRLNIMFDIPSLHTMNYLGWAAREGKSLLSVWDGTPGRFWSVRLTRLILVLGKLDAESSMFNIWVRNGGSAISIKTFVSSPPKLIEVTPKKLFKITEK